MLAMLSSPPGQGQRQQPLILPHCPDSLHGDEDPDWLAFFRTHLRPPLKSPKAQAAPGVAELSEVPSDKKAASDGDKKLPSERVRGGPAPFRLSKCSGKLFPEAF